MKPNDLRKRQATVHRWVRVAVQAVFLLLAPSLFNAAFNGVKYLFTQLGVNGPVAATSFLVLLVGSVAFTIVFGRFFCGYACAFGTVGDWLYGAFEFVRAKTPIPRPRFSPRLVKILSAGKYVVLAAICAACFFAVWPEVSGYSPWVAFAGIIDGSLDGVAGLSIILLGLVAVGMIVRERFFCQFLCPMGAVFSLLPMLRLSQFKRIPGHCARNCGRCHDVCPVDIWPDAESPLHGECISCGKCADSCPLSNVNIVAVEKALYHRAAALDGPAPARICAAEKPAASEPEKRARVARAVRKTKEAWHLVRGTENAVVLGKAAALLALCWVLGATRNLPSPGEVAQAVAAFF